MINTETLYRLGQKGTTGLTAYEVSLALTHVTKALFDPVLSDSKTKSQAFNQARQVKADAYATLRSKRAEADTFLLNTRNYLSAFIGFSWSAAWAPLGFINGNLQMPDRDAGRCQLLEKFALYFANHAAHENVALLFTGARATFLCTALTDALAVIDNCKVDTRDKRDKRDAAEILLDKTLHTLWTELETVLPPTDPRWLKFIDRIPGDPRVPEAVEDVTAQAQPGGIIVLDWDDATRAASYQVYKQVVGVDAEPVLALTVDESDAQLTGLPHGATVRLQIIATNSVGPGAPSEVIELLAA